MSKLDTQNSSVRLDNQAPELFGQTPSQTVGPYFHYGLPWKGGADLVGQSDMGCRPDLIVESYHALNLTSRSGVPRGGIIDLRGHVLDGMEAPIPDVMLEIWQANAAGRYASPADRREELPLDPHFIGFGRSATLEDGSWHFRTVRPGRVPGPNGALQAPHIALSVFGRGLLKRLATRIYFADCAANELDPVLMTVPAARRSTLIAQRHESDWHIDIVLQGSRETVFFAL